MVLRDEPGTDEVRAALGDAAGSGGPILVPEVFWLEVVNVLGRRYRYPPEAIVEAIYELEQSGVTTAEIGRPATLAVIDAIGRTGLTAYDALYLVLAESADARLLTADRALARAAGERGMLVGDAGRIGEEPAAYGSGPTWPQWRGADRYLTDLRASVG
jgi:predicted nucleic acid-binding protein